jgi:Flp pilus assembly protein TadG
MPRNIYRIFTGTDGASSVEFALLLPILVMLLTGIIQLGMAYSNYVSITHAAREGARLAAVDQYSDTIVRERAYPVVPNSVSLSYPNGNTHGQEAVVTVTFTKTIDIPFWGKVSVPITSRAGMRIEY